MSNIRKTIVLPTGQELRVSTEFSPVEAQGFHPELLAEVINERAPALHMRNALNGAWCDKVSSAFVNHRKAVKERVDPPIYSIGSHLYSCGSGQTVPCYFEGLEASMNAIDEILPDKSDPIVEFLKASCIQSGMQFEYLSHEGRSVRHGTLRLWGADQSVPFGQRCYFALPHEDYEETNVNHPLLTQIHNAGNIYTIIACIDAIDDKEPETVFWDRRMTLSEIADPANKNRAGSYGFDESLLASSKVNSVRLKKGDVAIIPAHKVHAVVGISGVKRASYMAFFQIVKGKESGQNSLIFRT